MTSAADWPRALDGLATLVHLGYTVGGNVGMDQRALAPAVDAVLREQLSGFAGAAT